MLRAQDIFYRFPRVIDLGLDRMRAALALVGNPLHRLPPVVHVAGTNGKGSTIAFLRAMFEAAGQRAHVYSSPHLVHIEERYRLAGHLITPEALLDYAQRLAIIGQQVPLTIFEAETLAAFLMFADTPADVVLLETGLGGLLDATNVVARPAACIITPIDLDHQAYLGDTISAIAREKAGIIKPNCPVIIGPQSDDALAVLEAQAQRLAAPMHICGQDWHYNVEPSGFTLTTDDVFFDLPKPSLYGTHQYQNAASAAMAAHILGLESDAIAAGITKAQWPARLHHLTRGRFADLARGNGVDLWLDGGHNPHGARAAAAFFAEMQQIAPMPLHLIVGMLDTKDATGFFEALAPLSPIVHAVPVASSAQGRAPIDICELARSCGLSAQAHANAYDALANIADARVVIIGSLYLAAEILADIPPT